MIYLVKSPIYTTLDMIVLSFYIIGFLAILLIVGYVLLFNRFTKTNKEKLRKRLFADRLMQTVVTVILVPVALSLLVEPDKLSGVVQIYNIFAGIVGLVILFISIILENKNHNGLEDILDLEFKYLIIKTKEVSINSKSSEEILDTNLVLIPLINKEFEINISQAGKIKFKLLGTNILFQPSTLKRTWEKDICVISVEELINYASNKKMPPYFELIIR